MTDALCIPALIVGLFLGLVLGFIVAVTVSFGDRGLQG